MGDADGSEGFRVRGFEGPRVQGFKGSSVQAFVTFQPIATATANRLVSLTLFAPEHRPGEARLRAQPIKEIREMQLLLASLPRAALCSPHIATQSVRAVLTSSHHCAIVPLRHCAIVPLCSPPPHFGTCSRNSPSHAVARQTLPPPTPARPRDYRCGQLCLDMWCARRVPIRWEN